MCMCIRIAGLIWIWIWICIVVSVTSLGELDCWWCELSLLLLLLFNFHTSVAPSSTSTRFFSSQEKEMKLKPGSARRCLLPLTRNTRASQLFELWSWSSSSWDRMDELNSWWNEMKWDEMRWRWSDTSNTTMRQQGIVSPCPMGLVYMLVYVVFSCVMIMLFILMLLAMGQQHHLQW